MKENKFDLLSHSNSTVLVAGPLGVGVESEKARGPRRGAYAAAPHTRASAAATQR